MGITFKEIGDDCSLCPIGKEGLCNGLSNYGDGPVYPPCSEMDEDTDVDAYMKNRHQQERRHRAYQIQLEKERQAAKRKSEIQKKRRRYMDHCCIEERRQIDALRKKVVRIRKDIVNVKDQLQMMKLLESAGEGQGNKKVYTDLLSKLNASLDKTQSQLNEAKKVLAAKQVEVRKTKEYQNIK